MGELRRVREPIPIGCEVQLLLAWPQATDPWRQDYLQQGSCQGVELSDLDADGQSSVRLNPHI